MQTIALQIYIFYKYYPPPFRLLNFVNASNSCKNILRFVTKPHTRQKE